MGERGWIRGTGMVLLSLGLAACASVQRTAPLPSDAQAHFLMGDYRRAVAGFDEAAKKTQDPLPRLYAAMCRIKLGQGRHAREQILTMIRRNRNPSLTARLHLVLSQAYALEGDSIGSLQAAQAAARAAAARPGHIPEDELLFVTGSAYLRAGRDHAGRRRLRKLVEQHPTSGLAARADLRLQLDGYGIRVGSPLDPAEQLPEDHELPLRRVTVRIKDHDQGYALVDGLTSFKQAQSLAGRLRRDGHQVEVLP